MANKFKKGDEVCYFTSSYPDGGRCYFAYYTVMSCGAKQMTLQSKNGQMLRTFVPAHWYDRVYLVVPGLDVAVIALRYAGTMRTHCIAHLEDCLVRYAGTTCPHYFASINKQLVEARNWMPTIYQRGCH